MIDDIIARRRIIITCGTGGVGKTTVSAAIALRAAMLGKRALVITIDPAKRLATSLGLDALSDHPTDLTAQFAAARAKLGWNPPAGAEGEGKFFAVIPDTRKTFETFMHSLSPTPKTAEMVLNNPLFKTVASEFSGANEYMALQKLDAMAHDSEYDCIILDTPPNRSTLTFLNASQTLTRLFEEKFIRWLIVPANRLVSVAMKKALGVLESFTGSGFIGYLIEFANALFEVQDRFMEKLYRVTALLESEDVGFVSVTTATPDTIPEFTHLIDAFYEKRFNFDGVVLNRTLGFFPPAVAEPSKSADHHGEDPLQQGLQIVGTLQDRERVVTDELQNRLAKLKGAHAVPKIHKLPELVRDVHSIEDLFHVALAFGPDPSDGAAAGTAGVR
ncbi:MAG: ArsA family ATPase [Bacteriovoracia bacterium]